MTISMVKLYVNCVYDNRMRKDDVNNEFRKSKCICEEGVCILW